MTQPESLIDVSLPDSKWSRIILRLSKGSKADMRLANDIAGQIHSAESTGTTVYIVDVDWGTMDGYRDHSFPYAACERREDADALVSALMGRRPFPVLAAIVYELVINAKVTV